MSKLKVGVIGGGGIPTAHVPHLQKMDDVEVVGVADVNPEAARNFAAKYELARQTADFHELLPDVDAVLVCVPTAFHAEIAVECLNAGKAVFCEKPMTRTREQAEALLAAAQKSAAPLQVGFVRRFDAEWLAFRDAVQASRIGRPVVWRDTMAGYGPVNAWFTQDELGGGPFLDGCIHNLDFSLYTFGPADWAFCHGRTLRESNTAIDTGTATVRFQSGDELMLAWSWGLPKGCSGARVFELLGPEGTISWPRDEAAGDTERRFVVHRGDEDKSDVKFASDSIHIGFRQQMEEFVAVARGEKQPRAGGREGLESLRVALAILESARTQQVVKI